MYGLDFDLDIWNSIRARQELRGTRRNDNPGRAYIGAHISNQPAAQPCDQPITTTGDFKFARHLARMVGCHQMFTTILDPFYRASSSERSKWNKKILRVEFPPYAEAAADVDLD